MNLHFANWTGIAVALLILPAFAAAWHIYPRLTGRNRAVYLTLSLVCSIPAVLFTTYYLHVLPERAWFYELRSWPGSEWFALIPGVAAGFMARTLPRILVPLLASAAVALAGIPHIKPLISPLDSASLQDNWNDGVCLQSLATCGPASTATILASLGIAATESEIARACHTSASGTEAWYLARHIRSKGMHVRFDFRPGLPDDLPLPAVVGVKLGTAGHFIAILSRNGEVLTVADPLLGRHCLTLRQLEAHSPLTGFHLCVSRP